MTRIDFDIRADVPPDAVREALLDFSERRPELWPGLPADQYEVYEVGETSAEIREGYRGRIWVRERYDWSVPGTVRFTVVDSGFAKPGSYVVVDIEPAGRGGSTLHITWVRWGKGVFGKLFVGLMALTGGAAIRRSFRLGLARIAATHAAG
jgi:polyketide cyclase/dehydrase/lipid transport protein